MRFGRVGGHEPLPSLLQGSERPQKHLCVAVRRALMMAAHAQQRIVHSDPAHGCGCLTGAVRLVFRPCRVAVVHSSALGACAVVRPRVLVEPIVPTGRSQGLRQAVASR